LFKTHEITGKFSSVAQVENEQIVSKKQVKIISDSTNLCTSQTVERRASYL